MSLRQLSCVRMNHSSWTGSTENSPSISNIAVAVMANLGADDVVFSSHRCHGHFLAYGGDPQALYAELMGKPSGVCGGGLTRQV